MSHYINVKGSTLRVGDTIDRGGIPVEILEFGDAVHGARSISIKASYGTDWVTIKDDYTYRLLVVDRVSDAPPREETRIIPAEPPESETEDEDELDEATTRAIALAAFLGEDIDDVDTTTHGDGETEFDAPSGEYLVLDDDEADERATAYIRDSLWAFNADYICHYMPDGIDADEVRAIVGDRCEDANAAMLALVNATGETSFQSLAESAMREDGRGHFMNSYDDEEHEHEHNGVTYYIYRTN